MSARPSKRSSVCCWSSPSLAASIDTASASAVARVRRARSTSWALCATCTTITPSAVNDSKKAVPSAKRIWALKSKPVAVFPWLDWLHRWRLSAERRNQAERAPNAEAKDSAREANRAITVLA